MEWREHLTRYKRNVDGDPAILAKKLKGRIRDEFPNLHARIGQSDIFGPTLVYRIPLFLGHNEASVGTVTYSGDGQPNRNEVYLNLSTESLLRPNRIHGKLKKILDEMYFSEEVGLRRTRPIIWEEIVSRNDTEFPLGFAEDIGDKAFSTIHKVGSKKVILYDIYSTNFGQFLQMYIQEKMATEKPSFDIKTEYNPTRRTLTLTKL